MKVPDLSAQTRMQVVTNSFLAGLCCDTCQDKRYMLYIEVDLNHF